MTAPQPITLDDIFALFRESEAERKAMYQSQQQAMHEFQQTMKESQQVWQESQQAWQQQFQQTMQESQQAWKQTVQESQQAWQESQQESQQAWRQAQQQAMEEHRRTVEREMAELRKVVADTNKKVGAISNRWGEFVENLVQPAVVRLLQAKGIQFHWTALNVVPEDRAIEIDILAENDTEIVAIEVKSFLEARDVKRFIKTLTKFKTVFPKYSNHKLYGAMAGIKVGTRAECDVVEAGLFLIKPAGDSVTIVNNEHFQPNIW